MQILSRIKRRLMSDYYRLRMRDPLWQWLNRASLRYLSQNPPALTQKEKGIVAALRRDGIATARIEDLVPENLWKEFKTDINERITSPEVQQKIAQRHLRPEDEGDKYYNITLVENPSLDLRNPMFKFAANDHVLAIVNTYLGLWAKFRGIRLWASLPVPEGAVPHASQRWHRDPEDRRIVKTFIYFNDVDKDTGPFTYIKGSQEGGTWRHLYPQLPPLGSYAPLGAVEKVVPQEDIVEATGRAGTIIFCDTSGLHKGGYCKKHPRYMYLGVYASPASIEPLGYTLKNVDMEPLSPESRYALTNRE